MPRFALLHGFLAAAVSAAVAPAAAASAAPGAPAQVLGADAEAPVAAWADGLAGVRRGAIAIGGAVVTIALPGCQLTLHHPGAVPCSAPLRAGNAAVCFAGEACPDAPGRRAAVAAAGDLALPWRAAAGARSELAGLDDARRQADTAWLIGDQGAVRRALLPWLSRPGVRVRDLIDVVSVAATAGAGAQAWEVLGRPDAAQLPEALRAALIVHVLLGADAGGGAALALVTPEAACALAGYGSSLLTVRAYEVAAALGEAARAADPGCLPAYELAAEAAHLLRRPGPVAAAARAARARWPQDPRAARLEEAALDAAGDATELIRRYEARVAAGDHSPGLFKRLFALLVKTPDRAQRVARWLARAEADPDDAVAALVAGVLLHYDKQHARSNALVARAAPAFVGEPRVYIYQAMNHFNLGDQALAERLIDQAEALPTKDPDVYYCRGEIYRDTDRARALAALKTYWHMTAFSSDPNSGKQRRVRAMMEAIAKCLRQDTPPPCPGPFEHTFGSSRP